MTHLMHPGPAFGRDAASGDADSGEDGEQENAALVPPSATGCPEGVCVLLRVLLTKGGEASRQSPV